MTQFSSFITFRIDPSLSQELRKTLDGLLAQFKDAHFEVYSSELIKNDSRLIVDLISENSLHQLKESGTLKICLLDKNQGLFSFGQNIEHSAIDAVLDDSMDVMQLQKLIEPGLNRLIRSREEVFYQVGSKNIRKFESRARQETQKSLDVGAGLTSENLLNYAQALVDLEKELIHANDLIRIEKVLKQFVKTNIEKSKFQYFSGFSISKLEVSSNLLTLPRYKNEFLAMELNWDDQDYSRLIKKLFFF